MYCGTRAAEDVASNGRHYEFGHGEHRSRLRDELIVGGRPHELHRSAPVFSIRCDAGSRRPVVCRMGHDAAFHFGREKTRVAGCDCSQAARARGVRAAAGCCETFARAPHGATSGAGRPTARACRTVGVYRGRGPADRTRKGRLVPLAVSRPGRCLPRPLDEQQDRAHGVFPGMRQRMDARRVREAAGALRRVSESGVRPGERPRDTGPPPGTSCRRRLSPACRRDVLVPRGGLRQGAMEEGRRRVPRRLRWCRTARRGRALALGQRGACVVLLRCAGVCSGGSANGLLSDYSGDVEASWSGHDLLRPAVPEPGHHASRWLREPDCVAAPARTEGEGQHRVRRRGLRPLSGPMGLPGRRAAHSDLHR